MRSIGANTGARIRCWPHTKQRTSSTSGFVPEARGTDGGTARLEIFFFCKKKLFIAGDDMPHEDGHGSVVAERRHLSTNSIYTDHTNTNPVGRCPGGKQHPGFVLAGVAEQQQEVGQVRNRVARSSNIHIIGRLRSVGRMQ